MPGLLFRIPLHRMTKLEMRSLIRLGSCLIMLGGWMDLMLTLEALRERGGKIDTPSIFLALNFCSLTDCQKLWHNSSLFVNTSFDTN